MFEPEPVEIPIDGTLDLHTFSSRDVPDLVSDYLEACRDENILEVRIVHGKGKGILKKKVHSVLARLSYVASFGPDLGRGGNWGATSVVLSPKVGLPSPMPDLHPALLDPAQAAAVAPERFVAELTTTKGPMVIDVERRLAPLGADRFYNLVSIGYYDNTAFFRVVAGFMAQVGIHGDPAVNKVWRNARIKDDPVLGHNMVGTVSFATSGRDARTTQIFINFKDNRRLDGMGFAPFGQVRDMSTVQALYDGYGEGAPSGQGPMQGRVHREGEAYLKAEFPQLDYIQTARIVD